MRRLSLSLLSIALLLPIPAVAADQQPSLQAQSTQQRTWKSVFGLSLTGAGLVSAGTGIARLLQSNDFAFRAGQYPQAEVNVNDSDINWLITESRAARTQSLLLLTLGGAAVIGGVLLYALDTPTDVNVTVGIAPGATDLVLTWRW